MQSGRFCRLRLASPRLRLASHVCVLHHTSASCVTARAGGPLLIKRRKMSGERGQSGRFLGGTLAGGGGVRDEPRVHSELSQNSDPALRPPGPAGSPPRPAPACVSPSPPRWPLLSAGHPYRLPTSACIRPLPSLL